PRPTLRARHDLAHPPCHRRSGRRRDPPAAPILVALLDQRVTQEMMRVQHERRLPPEIGHDDPFFARGVDPLKERIVGRRFEGREDASAARQRQANDALRVHGSPSSVTRKSSRSRKFSTPVASTFPLSPPLPPPPAT